GAPSNKVRERPEAGVGDQPPRLDSADKADRLVCWLRLRPQPEIVVNHMTLSWLGINTVEIDQRQSVSNRGIGISSGSSDQEFALPGTPVEPETLVIQVEDSALGYVTWQRIDDLNLAGRDSNVYSLDPEAGTIRFGDGLRGRA